jgi:catechol 2,3-dioxygenase-like lactoylglutathione lyase family enzyme
MLDHVSITVFDIAVAEPFYDAIMAALGVVKVGARADWLGYGERARPEQPERVYISIRRGDRPEPAYGRHWCFKAASRAAVDAFWQAGLAHGGTDQGSPGLRTHYHPSYYAAFVADPDGNRLEAVCHTITTA